MHRTLKAITGGRPRCEYCDKPLRPWTDTVEVFGHLDEALEEETLPLWTRPTYRCGRGNTWSSEVIGAIACSG